MMRGPSGIRTVLQAVAGELLRRAWRRSMTRSRWCVQTGDKVLAEVQFAQGRTGGSGTDLPAGQSTVLPFRFPCDVAICAQAVLA